MLKKLGKVGRNLFKHFFIVIFFFSSKSMCVKGRNDVVGLMKISQFYFRNSKMSFIMTTTQLLHFTCYIVASFTKLCESSKKDFL